METESAFCPYVLERDASSWAFWSTVNASQSLWVRCRDTVISTVFPSGLEMKPRKQGNRTYMEMPKAVTPGERGARTPMDQKTFYVSMYLGRLEAVSNQLSSTIVIMIIISITIIINHYHHYISLASLLCVTASRFVTSTHSEWMRMAIRPGASTGQPTGWVETNALLF